MWATQCDITFILYTIKQGLDLTKIFVSVCLLIILQANCSSSPVGMFGSDPKTWSCLSPLLSYTTPLHAAAVPLAGRVCVTLALSLGSAFVLQLCWLRWKHSDGHSNEPSLAPNLSHISRANTGSLLAATLHSLLTSCSDAPPGFQPQSTGPTNVYSGHCNVFIHRLRECISCSLLGATHVYALVFPPRLCLTVNLTYHTPPPVTPIMLSLALLGSLSSSVFSGLWPVLSVIFPPLQAPVAPAT